MTSKADNLVTQLADEIGTDIVYVTAADKERHFDPATLAISFATMLALTFLKGFMGAAQADFEKLGQAAYSRLMTKLRQWTAGSASTDPVTLNEQTRTITEAQQATNSLPDRATLLSRTAYIGTGTERVSELLSSYHFSDSRKRQLSTVVSTTVIEYLKDAP